MIRMRRIDSDVVHEYAVERGGDEIIDIPPGYTHNITNTGSEDLITVFWANEIFNRDKTDTYYEEV
jgi:UDP-2-acetamido-2,6-beta-L-arabino-hexul-4-ose reductase